MENNAIIRIKKLGFPWETSDPFLFCVHHLDYYPAGNDEMGPAASLAGRNLGMDFTIKDGWRMYHGKKVPGFPTHPHRGFETITVTLQGFIDHFDSKGATGRYGNGDVQWMTAGAGLQHAEMFPLLDKEGPNTNELFQIWLNLPKSKKHVAPYFGMLWGEEIPEFIHQDTKGKYTKVKIIAGSIENLKALPPAPDSWAANPENEVAVWTFSMEPGAVWKLPKASDKANRSLYFYDGKELKIAGKEISINEAVWLHADMETEIENGSAKSFMLLLQGRPINEPVVQQGPFVMNSPAEIYQAYDEYQKTQFGGWPWSSFSPVHPRSVGRYSKFADGREVVK